MLRRSCSQLSAFLLGGKWSWPSGVWTLPTVRGFATTITDVDTTTSSVASSTSISLDGKEQVWVGNLSFKAHHKIIWERFKAYGAVRVFLMRDKETGRSRGMALVAIDKDKCEKAIAEVNGTEFMGRTLSVAMSTIPLSVAMEKAKHATVQAAATAVAPETGTSDPAVAAAPGTAAPMLTPGGSLPRP